MDFPVSQRASLAAFLRARVGRRLEAGAPDTSYLGRAAAALWGAVAARAIARPLELPKGMRVIAVGSAVLGGAGKTPVAVELARELSRRGARVALIAHSYRAAPSHPREVRAFDSPDIVGDDALSSARLLSADGVPVIVAPSRRAAVLWAKAIGAEIAVIDGMLQASPERVADAVLVLDERSPWGSRRCPPLGDLRAPEAALRAAADLTAVIVDTARELDDLPARSSPADSAPEDAVHLTSSLEGAIAADGARHDLTALRGRRLGLLLAIARPERVVHALARRGIEPSMVVALEDHASFCGIRAAPSPGVDAWLTTARCSTKLPSHVVGAPVLALDHRVDVLPLVHALLSRGVFGVRSVVA